MTMGSPYKISFDDIMSLGLDITYIMKGSMKQNLTLLGVIALGSVAITVTAEILSRMFVKKYQRKKEKNSYDEQEVDDEEALPEPPKMNVQQRRTSLPADKIANYGALKIAKIDSDPILFELQKMSSAVSEVERVNNLIVDLELQDVRMYPNPIIAHKTKKSREDPFMSPDALTLPYSFVLDTTEVRIGDVESARKKWLRAGPRSTIYFHPSSVKAGIVSMGGMVPGVNTVIKELVYTLQEYYGVKQIIGIKHSFQTNRKQSVDLNIERVKTLHHYGGSFLGVSRVDSNACEIVDRLQNAKVNQLYLIGGPGTLRLACDLRQTIRKRKLNIALCVIPKQITNAIPITERSIGFETALEETQKMVESGYTESHAHDNGVAIIKVAGRSSGFLAVETALASRNIQACLVPEFPFELFGEKGLLEFIYKKLRERSNCTIVVAEGANQSILDYQPPIASYDWDNTPIKEDINVIIKKQLKKYLGERNFKTNVKVIDTFSTRASPANAQDTRVCCRYAAESIHGVMSGYTNFMIGSILGRTVMIPLFEVTSGNYSDRLTESSSQWIRLLLTTCQPSFRNSE